MKKITIVCIAVLAIVPQCLAQNGLSPIDTPAVYQIAGMEKITPKREAYKTVDDGQLSFDIYAPPDVKSGERRGVVVFSNWKGRGRTEWALMVSWGRIIAASGLNAVVYQSGAEPHRDINDIVQYLRKNAVRLNIDEDRIAIFTTSGNTVAAMPFVTAADRPYIRCTVIYYGMLSYGPDAWTLSVRRDLPIMLVRAGLEVSAELNKQLDTYIKMLSEQNAPVTFINYPDGHHAFDMVDKTVRTEQIIRETLEFLNRHLRR